MLLKSENQYLDGILYKVTKKTKGSLKIQYTE